MTGVGRSPSEPRRLLQVHTPWVLAMTVAVLAGAWLLTSHRAVAYVSTSEVVVETAVLPNTTPLAPNMATERQLVTSGVVLTRAAKLAGTDLDTMRSSSSVTVPADTSFLAISCEAGDPSRAQRCASALARTYVAYRNAAAPTAPSAAQVAASAPAAPAADRAAAGRTRQATQGPVDAVLVSPADLPTQPSGVPRAVLLGIAAGLGLALGVGTAFLRDRFDDRLRGRADAERCLGAPIPALVPRIRGTHAATVVTEAPRSPAAEVYRYLRVRLEAALLDPAAAAASARGRAVLVVGGRDGDGSTTVASNLALGFALAGRRTVLVDADISRAGVETLFGPGERVGLMDLLAGSVPAPATVLWDSPLTGLRVLTVGSPAQRRPELLRADRLGAVLDRLRDDADLIVVDGTSLAAASDAVMLATVSDLVLVVLDAGRTTRAQVDQVASELRSVGVTEVLGVLNRVRPRGVPWARGRARGRSSPLLPSTPADRDSDRDSEERRLIVLPEPGPDPEPGPTPGEGAADRSGGTTGGRVSGDGP